MQLAPPDRARLGRAEPHADLDARRGDAATGPRRPRSRSAGSCSRSSPAYVRFRHELARQRDQVERPHGRPAAAARARSSTRCSPRAPTPPTSSTTPRPPAPRTSSPSTRSWRRGARPRSESNREAYSHYRRAADFVDRLAAGRAGGGDGGAGDAPRTSVGRLEDAFAAIERAIAALRAGSATRRPSAGARAMLARLLLVRRRGRPRRARRRARRSRSSSRSASRSSSRAPTARNSQLAMLARGRRGSARVGRARARPRRSGSATSGRACTRSSTSAARRSRSTTATPRRCSRRSRSPTPRGAARGGARAVEPRLTSMLLGAPRRRRSATPSRALAYARSTRCTRSRRTSTTTHRVAAARAGEWDEAGRIVRRELERGRRSPSCSPGPCSPSWRSAAATRTRTSGWPSRRAGRSHRRAAAVVPALELAIERALTAGEPVPLERIAARARGRGAAAGGRALWFGAWAAVAGVELEVDAAAAPDAARGDAARRLAGGGRRLRRGRLAVRARAACCRCSTTRSRSSRRSRSRAGSARSR